MARRRRLRRAFQALRRRPTASRPVLRAITSPRPLMQSRRLPSPSNGLSHFNPTRQRVTLARARSLSSEGCSVPIMEPPTPATPAAPIDLVAKRKVEGLRLDQYLVEMFSELS